MAAKTSEWRPGPTVCRCCLSEGCYKDISTEYFWMGKREVYSEMLAETFDLSISYSKSGGPNSHSRLICEPCIARLRDAADFKRQVQECERTFVQCLDPATALSEVQVSLDLEKEVKVEVVKEEKAASDDDLDDARDYDDDDYDDLDDQPLTKLASKIPKKEAVDVMELLDSAKLTQKRKSSSKIKSQSSKKSKSKQTATSSKQKPEPKPKKKDRVLPKEEFLDESKDTMEILKQRRIDDLAAELDIKQEDCSGEGETEQNWTQVAERRRERGFGRILRENTLKMLEMSTMVAFQYNKSWYACLCCRQSFMTTYMLRDHMADHTLSDIKGKLFTQSIHQLVKVDISLLKCKLCSQESSNLSSLDEFRHHLLDVHAVKIDNGHDLLVPYKLETEGLKCQLCSETFDSFWVLNMHVNTHFRNRICEVCGKSFISLAFLNLHKTRFHRTFRCNECGLTFESGASKKRHDIDTHDVKFERKQRYPCQYCGERFFQECLKIQHLVDKHGVEKPEYKCALCLKAFITKSLLNNHVKSVHKKERKHECDICHSVFYTKSDVVRHRVTHTREKKFSCTLCNSAFATKGSLRRHLNSTLLHETGK